MLKENLPRDEKGKFLKGVCYYPSTMKDPVVKERMRVALKGRRLSPETEFKQGRRPWNKGRGNVLLSKRNRINNPMGYPEARRRNSTAQKGHHSSPITEFRKGQVAWNKGKKNCWSEEVLKKMLTRREPNNEEQFLINLFRENGLPYKYVGNGKVILGGKNPDFINVNGQKKIIEFFGEHWHNIRDEQKKRDIYSTYGFEMLGIWGKELKNPGKLISKILNFEYGGS